MPGFEAAGPIGGRSVAPRALSRGQATPACLRRWSRAVRRGREAGDSGPAATPGHESEVAPEIETRGQTRGRAGPSLWAARDGDVAGLTPGPVQRHPARASGRTPASVPPENRERVLSGDRTGPGRAGWGGDAAQTRMVTSRALAEDPQWASPVPAGACGKVRRLEPQTPGLGHRRAPRTSVTI